MYKVFVVDDEIVIREGIRNALQQDESRFVLVGEAPDGEMALPMIRDMSPDILITDIRMPFMDGIALCEEVRRTMSWVQIVILSGYDDFKYAQKAISMGVQEYILKPVDAEGLHEILERLAARYDAEFRDKRRLERLRQQVMASRNLVSEQMIYRVVTGSLTENENREIVARLRDLGLNIYAACYAAVEFRLNDDRKSYLDAYTAVINLADDQRETVYLCSDDTHLMALVLGDKPSDIEERAYSFARSAIEQLHRAGFRDASAMIGKTVQSLSTVRDSYRAARHARHELERRHVQLSMHPVMGCVDVEDSSMSEHAPLELQTLYDRVKYASPDDLQSVMLEHVRTLRQADAYIPISYSFLHTEVMLTAFRIMSENGCDPSVLLSEQLSDAEAARRSSLEDGIAEECRILSAALSCRDSNSSLRSNPVINKARVYLEEHNSDPSLTFQDVLDQVSMSSSHFSTLFSQSMGMTFTEYLIQLRMDHAKELLLNTAMRSSEIAYAVGYNDPHYFSYVFKKKNGISPSEFRSNAGVKKD